MANDPPFATLNHFAADLGIPSESDLLRIGISRYFELLWNVRPSCYADRECSCARSRQGRNANDDEA
jgi:hypothetical protein